MQLIPVFDIKGGIMVHAVGGLRRNYQPLRTSLLPVPDPKKACATLVGLGFRCFYIADLDAITGEGDNLGLVRELVDEYPVNVWLDAGLTGPERLPLLDVQRVSLITGSETLVRFGYLRDICSQAGQDRVIFSLDTRNGELLTADTVLTGADPGSVAAEVLAFGIKEIIVLDLKDVGSGGGLNKKLLGKLIHRVPGARFFPGGGLTRDNIVELKEMDIPGVLTATALYSGQIEAVPEL